MPVRPLTYDGVVLCPECDGAEMKPELGWDTTQPAFSVPHVWWRCEQDPFHISESLPDPERRKL